MKHFIIEIRYLLPIDQMTEIIAEHRQFLQGGYERGMLLCSGPRVPRTGGFIIARAESIEVIQTFFKDDPYYIKGVGEHAFMEFEPVKRQSFLDSWVTGEA